MSASGYRARAFGVDWSSDIPLDRFDTVEPQSSPARFRIEAITVAPERTIVRQRGRGAVCADGFRLRWFDIATFDAFADGRIVYTRGPRWTGTMPETLYSTVAALVLAGSGALPLHATAVVWQGRAFLLMGAGGAGKSTLGAELLEAGAQLVGDDLTILAPRTPHQALHVTRGRPTMRLHPALAGQVDAVRCEDPGDPRGKLLVEPRRRVADGAFPVAGVLVLDHGDPGKIAPGEAITLLPQHLFRKRWCAALPDHGRRRADLLALAAQVPVWRMAPVAGFDSSARAARVERVLEFFAAAG